MTTDLLSSLATQLKHEHKALPKRKRTAVAPTTPQEKPTTKPTKAPKYKLPRVSFQPADWQALYAAVAADKSPDARVLQLQMLTGARVGDVLRIGRSQLTEALEIGVLPMKRKGGRVTNVSLDGALPQWQALLAAWPERCPTVAQWVSPGSGLGAQSGGGAYQRCRRKLKALGAQLGIRGRVHLHRIRRTVAVAALAESGGNLHPVAQLLGHATTDSTQEYVDEFNATQTAALTKKLAAKLNPAP